MNTRVTLALFLAWLGLSSASERCGSCHSADTTFSHPISRIDGGNFSTGSFLVDSLRLNMGYLDSLAERLGARVVSREQDRICYERRVLGRVMYAYCFDAIWTQAKEDRVVAESNGGSIDHVRLRKGHLFGHYGFEDLACNTTFQFEENLPAFLHSAYQQHAIPGYREQDSRFISIPGGSQVGLWLRGAVSPVWAARYVTRDNPFAGRAQGGSVRAIYYVTDGVFGFLALFATAALIAHDQAELIPRSLLFIEGFHVGTSLAFCMPIMSMDFGETIRIRNSGYRIPISLRKE
jgi:hypothetical protein